MYSDHMEENLKRLESHEWCVPVASPPGCHHSAHPKIIYFFPSTSFIYDPCIFFLTNSVVLVSIPYPN